MQANTYRVSTILLILMSLYACKKNESAFTNSFEVNKGKIEIIADENYEQITDELIKSYENIFDSTDIVPTYENENAAISKFMNDSIHLMLIGRRLKPAEINNATLSQGIPPREHIIAYDAIAAVTLKNSNDTLFDLDAFIANRNGNVKNKFSDTKFIFTSAQSGTLAYLFEKTGLANPSTQNMFAVDSLQQFISYLQKNTNTVGFLPYTLISDIDDPQVKEILEDISLMKVVHTDTSGRRMIVELSQSTIATKEYPLVRPINLVLGNASERLGTGFVNFMYKSQPGRIFLKAGLIPAQIPERQIKINTN
ncbi:MAG: PstS family phosphate ABC transporter substrate-binding protein [Chitinophagales bacterium]